jgi:hypothetical protein
MPVAHKVTAQTAGDWEEEDFAPPDASFKGRAVGSMALPHSAAFHFDKKSQRIGYVRFPSSAPQDIVHYDEGTTFRMAFLQGNADWINAKMHRALRGYVVRFFRRADGLLWDRGMYVLVAIDRAAQLWHFRRLHDRLQSVFPTIEEFFEYYADEADQPTTKQTVHAVAVTPPMDCTPQAKASDEEAPAKRPAPSQLNSGDVALLGWFARESCGDAVAGEPLTAFVLDQVVERAQNRLGWTGAATPEFVAAVVAAFSQHGCIVSRTPDTSLLNGPALRLLPASDVLPVRALPVCTDPAQRTVHELRGEKTFRSRLEFEQFMMLWRLVPCVLYEGETFSLWTDAGLMPYTPDFYLPGVRADFSLDPAGGLLIESKAEYPSLEEIAKCLLVTEQGRDIVLLYGYPGAPIRVDRDPASAGGRSRPHWRRGILAMTFRLVDAKAEIAEERAFLVIEDGALRVRRLAGIEDRGWMHERLTTLYEEIEAVASPQ